MRIQMVGHSSIILSTASNTLWCDPWLSGTIFNNGWALSPEPVFDAGTLETINYIWISHEHPDHLHFPTLKALPADFKQRVTILFQKNNSDKVFAAIRKLGFVNFQSVPHFQKVRLGEDVVAVYQHRHLDSALIVAAADGTKIINVNDAELNMSDCRKIFKLFGGFDACINQFSIAGYDGIESRLKNQAKQILNNMVEQHRALGAAVTVPFASFVYFCKPDNFKLNQYANTALETQDHFKRLGLTCHLMFPGTEKAVRELTQGDGDREKFGAFYRARKLAPAPLEESIPFDKIVNAFQIKINHWKAHFPGFLLRKMGKICIHIRDLKATYVFDFRNGSVVPADPSQTALLEVNSQPWHFALSLPFGVQTLGVSGRYDLKELTASWKLVRIVSSLDNAEIYLKLKYLFSWSFLTWVASRLGGLFPQIWQQVKRFSS